MPIFKSSEYSIHLTKVTADPYDEWLDKNYDDLICECAESGADRELDFDFDNFCENRYFEKLMQVDSNK